jgi:hypothetical protein
LTKQEHARKYHSYFWVFEKVKPKVKYQFMNKMVELDSQETPNT